MITGLAHSGVCVPDCDAAVAFYRDVLGLRVLSPPYVMAGDAIRDDMGQLVSDPTMKAAIVGFDDDGDRVLEVIEYLGVAGSNRRSTAAINDFGLSHVGLICEDLDATRAELEAKGVRFLVDGIADVRTSDRSRNSALMTCQRSRSCTSPSLLPVNRARSRVAVNCNPSYSINIALHQS